MKVQVICEECSGQASLVGGEEIYPHRLDLWAKKFWKCSCGAYVGCHAEGATVHGVRSDGTIPLGTPAGPALRKLRSECHAAFDPMWKGSAEFTSRKAAYAWLSKIMGFEVHFSQLSEQQCKYALSAIANKWLVDQGYADEE